VHNASSIADCRGTPRVFEDPRLLRHAVVEAQRQGAKVGLVPTMGALHEGHLSLVDACRSACDVTVASIFVNPTQFGPREDLASYPRSLPRDLQLLAERGCQLAFVPEAESMYGPRHDTYVDVGAAARGWEGAIRPTHFRGVATVVLKLFHIIPADCAFFGQKDYQQTVVVKQMAADLDVPIEIRVLPTVRESDGLAMSSRNAYLTPDQRAVAPRLWESLQLAQSLFDAGVRDADRIQRAMQASLAAEPQLELQYVACFAEGTLCEVERLDAPTIVALAARLGATRLIDNHRLA